MFYYRMLPSMTAKIDIRIVAGLILISVVSTYFVAPYLSGQSVQPASSSTCATIPSGRTLRSDVHDYSCLSPQGISKATFSVTYRPTGHSIPVNVSLYTIDLTLVGPVSQNATGFFTVTFPSEGYYFIEIQHDTPWSEGGAEYYRSWYLFMGNPSTQSTFFGAWSFGPADWPSSPYK